MNAIINSTVVFGTPLLIAAIAGLISERTAVLNVGLEGFMLGGAFMAAWLGGNRGSVLLGLLGAVAVGVLIGVVYGFIVVRLRADQVAVGIAFNLFMLGLTGYGFDLITKAQGQAALQTKTMTSISIPGLDSIPWFGPIFDQPWLTFVGYALVPITAFVLFRTGFGVRARACGEYAEGARAAGLDVVRWRIGATAISGLLASAAGAYLVLADSQQFVQDMTAGKGYIALAVIILARWSPVGAVAAAALFGGAQALDLQAQSGDLLGIHLPVALVQTLPYVVTIIAVTVVGRRVRAPAEDGKPLALG
jgi:simple sugar transport system permease protein